MTKHNQDGSINVLLLPLIIAAVLLMGAIGFGYWAFGSRQDYKDNVDQKISAAVTVAKQQEDAIKAKDYAEQAKQPLKTYHGPEQYGSLSISYPRTWSSYVDSSGSGAAPFDGYFMPDTVPAVEQQSNTFALRVQLVAQSYSEALASYNDQENITIAPYALPKLPKVIGIKITGQIEDAKNGTMIVLPLRGQTLKIYTEAQQYQADFDTNILPNLSFSP